MTPVGSGSVVPAGPGLALVGRDLPHLTFMLCSPDRETHKKNWSAFAVHPVWVALKWDAEWRWLRDRDDSPWYPRTRLFRQAEAGDWAGVFARMSQALQAKRQLRTP